MPYASLASRQHKGLLVLLLDQSYSMDDPFAGSANTMADGIAMAINSLLRDEVLVATNHDGVKDRLDLAVIGYGSDDEGSPIVVPAFIGPLAGREIVSLREISCNPARIDGPSGLTARGEAEIHDMNQMIPVWIDSKTRGNGPICWALVKACELLDAWIPQHPKSFPPVVVNITDGIPGGDDTDAAPYAESVRQRSTEDGEVLFFNCCLAACPDTPLLFPDDAEEMPDAFARYFFEMSSILPQPFLSAAKACGENLRPMARGFAYHADMLALKRFLRVVCRVPHF